MTQMNPANPPIMPAQFTHLDARLAQQEYRHRENGGTISKETPNAPSHLNAVLSQLCCLHDELDLRPLSCSNCRTEVVD